MLGSSPVASDAATRDGVTEARRQQSEETLCSQVGLGGGRHRRYVLVGGTARITQVSVTAPPSSPPHLPPSPHTQLSTAEERLHADELDACRGKATSV